MQKFSLRQLIISVTLIAAGFGSIGVGLRNQNPIVLFFVPAILAGIGFGVLLPPEDR
jgi:hypothetical protein